MILLSLIASLTAAAESETVHVFSTSDTQGSFDIKGKILPSREFQITKAGWNVLFEVDGQRSKMDNRYQGRLSIGGVTVNTEFSYPYILRNLIQVKFTVKNTDQIDPHLVSLSCSAELQVGQFTQTWLNWYNYVKHHRGISIGVSNLGLALIAKDAYQVENVDSIWFGPISSDSYYFKNKTDDGDSDAENAFSFSWVNRILEPGEEKSFSVVFAADIFNKREPAYIIMDPIQPNYVPNAKISVSGRIYSLQRDQTVTYKYGYANNFPEGRKSISTYSSRENGGVFSIPITVPSEYGCYPYKITADDGNGMETNDVNFNICVNNFPILEQVITRPYDNIYNGGYFEFAATVYDEKNCKLRYSIDEGLPRTADVIEMGSQGVATFSKIFPARHNVIKTYGKHSINLWVEDEFKFKSQTLTYEFDYKPEPSPIIQITSGTYFEIFSNETLDLDMTITYPIHYKDLTLSVQKPGNIQYENVYTSRINSGDSMSISIDFSPGELSLTEGQNYTVLYKVSTQEGANSIASITVFLKEMPHVDEPAPEPAANQSSAAGENNSGQAPEIHAHESDANANIAFADNGKVPKKKNSKGIVIGIAVALVLAAIAIAAIILVYEARKKAKEYEFNSEEEKVVEVSQSYCSQDNPMYSQDLPNDPFVEDFEEPNEEIVCDEVVDPEIR